MESESWSPGRKMKYFEILVPGVLNPPPLLQVISMFFLGFHLHRTCGSIVTDPWEIGPDALFSSLLFYIKVLDHFFLPLYSGRLWWLLYWFMFLFYPFEHVKNSAAFPVQSGKYGHLSPSGRRTCKVNGLAY